MRPPGRRRLVLPLALCAAALSWGVALAQDDPARLAVTSKLPRWLAPEGRLVVRGTGGPGEVITVSVGGAEGSGKVSRHGNFVVRVPAPAADGSYKVRLESRSAARLALGTVEVRPVRLAAVGDVNLGDRVGTAISSYGARYPWLSVAPVLRSADIALANLECSISNRGSPWPGKLYTFRGAPSSLRAMADYAGVDVVSLANNHSLDYGRLAFADTLSYAHDFGLRTIGGGRDLAAARRPAFIRIGGIRIALLGYSDVRPLGFDAGTATSGTAPAFPEYIAADVRRARERAEVVVVYFHWGIERTSNPTERQRSLARVAFDAGATVVLGAHPHVLQPIDRPQRHRLVAWSLGNFVFGSDTGATQRTGILRIRLVRPGVLRHGLRRARIGGTFNVQPILQ
jgi:poly-gamma-glutamate capsule biosynthesis protein CapA/YwtB (metallophosphatase superfamily)